MRLNKERKIYVGILGLGLAAVAVDRLALSGGPAGVSAAINPAMPDAAAAQAQLQLQSSVLSQAQGQQSAAVPVSRRLQEYASRQPVADAFVVPDAWVEKEAPVVAEVAQNPAMREAEKIITVERPDIEAIRKRVTSVVGRGDQVAAIIDNEVIRVGHTTKAGMTLKAVKGQEVTVVLNNQEFTLKFDDAAHSQR